MSLIPGKLVACDTETTGLNPWSGDRPFAFSFCNEQFETRYIECPVDPWTRRVTIPERDLLCLQSFFGDESITKIFHHAKFDVRMLEKSGFPVAGPGGLVQEGGQLHETMFMVYAQKSDEPLGLKALADRYCDIDTHDEEDLQRLIRRLRRQVSRKGWAIGESRKAKADGSVDKESHVPADYWLVGAVARYHPELLSKAEIHMCERYAVRDAQRTMMLYLCMLDCLQETDTWDTYEAEMRLWPVTYRMEERGVAVSMRTIRQEIANNRMAMFQLEQDIKAQAWPGFNLHSDAHKRRLIYEIRGHEVTRKTDTGLPSADQIALRPLREIDPVVDMLVRHKRHEKSLGTYFLNYRDKAVPDPLVPGGYVIHPDFRQVGPVTGRYSCANPNLQNVATEITSTSIEPFNARAPFRPRPGYVWYLFDYSQLEIIIFGCMAQEENLLRIIRSGKDIPSYCALTAWGDSDLALVLAAKSLEIERNRIPHSEAAIKALQDIGVSLKDLRKMGPEGRTQVAHYWLSQYKDLLHAEEAIGKKNARATAKILFYLKIYGGGLDAAARVLNQPTDVAKRFVGEWDDAFPGIATYMWETIGEAKKTGGIYTAYGRWIPATPGKEYRCVNYSIQGSAADLLKRAMVKIDEYLRQQRLDGYLLMTIHDELVVEIHRSAVMRRHIIRMRDLMADSDGVFELPTPVKVELVTGQWDKPIKVLGL